MADAFEFDAPNYADLTNPDSYDTNFSWQVSDLKLESNKSSTAMNDIAKVDISNVMEVEEKVFEPSIRQSPRLATLVKDMLSKKQVKSVRASHHRRSLSEGAIIHSNLMKVKKTSIAKKSPRKVHNANFNQEDLKNLEQTTSNSNHLKPTKPKEFHFATDSRIKNSSNGIKEDFIKDFARTLRSSNSSTKNNKQISRGPTKIKAFNLHESKKTKEESKPFVSMAELNLKFESKTPLRFRTKKCSSVDSGNDRAKKARNENGVTITHTPQLQTRLRARPAAQYPTREEIEMKELEEAQKGKFKAQPLNKKIFELPKLELKDKKKSVTIPQPFDITDYKKQTNEDVGKKLIAACRGMVDSTWSLASIPHSGIAANWEKKSTQLKPFSFASRDMQMLAKKKKNIEKLIEEEKKLAEFHAQTMPTFEGGTKGLPTKKVSTPTRVRPFNLRSEIRGLTKQEHLQKQLHEVMMAEEEARKFQAQSDDVVHKKPFIPEKSKKPLTDISGFSLNTEKRAEERLPFDKYIKQKEDEIMAQKRVNEERRIVEEEAEVRRLRKEVVHKAKPVPNYKAFQIKTGLLPSTLPITPEFETDRRIKTRTKSKQELNSSAAINSTFDMDK